MKTISGDEATALWKGAGLWGLFQRASQHIFVAFPQGKANRRIFYGQKNYPNPEKNFVVVLDCDDDEELERVTKELHRRMPTFSVDHEGKAGDVAGMKAPTLSPPPPLPEWVDQWGENLGWPKKLRRPPGNN
jgi:hypothetical protein